MSRIIVLDAGPLGMVSNPKALSEECLECQEWLKSMLSLGYVVAIPEVVDYEIRRELIRANRLASIRQLDAINSIALYLPITTVAMRKAAELWAIARQTGKPTADPQALDGDVILSAQVLTSFDSSLNVIIATTNVSHISRYAQAQHWKAIG
jgi:predicted nucleic acid-binding protein